MKKFFLAVIVIAIAISCSTETSQQEINETKFNTKSGNDLKSLFDIMVASQTYMDRSKIISFYTKDEF